MKKTLVLILAFVVITVLFAACGGNDQSASEEVSLSSQGSSAVSGEVMKLTIEVVHADKKVSEISVETTEKTLGDALVKANVISGEKGEYGLFVTTVDGETADSSVEQWWCITKDGQSVSTGVDGIEIADGDKYEFTLTEGYGDYVGEESVSSEDEISAA